MRRRRNEGDLERALREMRIEPDAEFVRRLAGDIRHGIRGERHRGPRWLSLGLAIALTAAIASALAAVGLHRSAGPATIGAVQVVKSAVSSPKNEVHVATHTPAQDEYEKCNSGRGNLSETESGTHQTDSLTPLVNPHEGGTGPGNNPTGANECDPGNSGPHNHGGD